MELPVRTSFLRLSDSKEESILLLELFGSGKNHSGVDLPLEEGGGAEDIQVATWLHSWHIEQGGILKKDMLWLI